MKKLVVMMLSLLLALCVAAPALAAVADVWITPGTTEIWIKQGDKVKFTASWWSNIEIVKIQWTMDGEVVWEKKVNEKKSSGLSCYTLHARDFAVKYDDDYVGSYELGFMLFDPNGPLNATYELEGYDEIAVFIEPRLP